MDKEESRAVFYEWSEADELEDDKEILLNEFKNDMNAVDAMEPNDLEEGILTHKRIRPVPKMTRDDRQRSKTQPQVHQKHKGIFESIFGTCCAPNHDLNKRELKYYKKFVQGSVKEYDASIPEHEEDL
jgi:hypothetical protein